MCVQNFIKMEQFSAKEGWRGKKVVKAKSTNFTRCATCSASNQKILSQGECRKLRLYTQFSQLLPLSLCQNSSKLKNFQGKTASEQRSQNKRIKFYEMFDLLCFQWQDLGSKELKKLKLCTYPIKKSSKSNIFRLKVLAGKKVVKPKSTSFTRCLTYSASNEKISGRKELKNLFFACT